MSAVQSGTRGPGLTAAHSQPAKHTDSREGPDGCRVQGRYCPWLCLCERLREPPSTKAPPCLSQPPGQTRDP